jgi:phytoene dehydrogenase-like protein
MRTMSDGVPSVDQIDVIVVGAGAAGVCCAGELVLRGLRPLLIAESREVGYQFRPKVMENGVAVAQYPTRNLYGEGGWWYSLAQRLDVSVKMHRLQLDVATTVLGSGVINDVSKISAPIELADKLASRSSVRLGSNRDVLNRVVHAGLTMPAEDLADLHNVSFAEWLENFGADEIVTSICMNFAVHSCYLSRDHAEQYLSVPGVFNRIRSFFCGQADLYSIEPNAREGLFMPLAAEIERLGGTVWRGRRVAQLLTDGDAVSGVVMDDATEARAPAVAIAAGSFRVSSLFPDSVAVPAEVQAVREFEENLGDYSEYTSFAIVNKSFYRPPHWIISTSNAEGTRIQDDWIISPLVPWATRPDQEMIGTELVRSQGDVAAAGGVDALYDRMRDVTDSLYPGFRNAVVEYATEQHPQFITPALTGPKLPRKSPSIRGLWFVGEGSTPVDGMYGEGAASAGILGARSIAGHLCAG